MRHAWPFLVTLALVLVLNACSSSSSPSTVSSTVTTTASAGQTFGQVADTGKTVFASRCSKCHGDSGQGVTAPAIIGSGANLGKYNTAQGLLDFIDTNMPFDAPGSLSSQEYQNVLAFLLVQNNYVTSGTAFNSNQFGNIQLKR